MITELAITRESINAAELLAAAGLESDGAVASFLGRVRDSSGRPGRTAEVIRLEYEAYEPMAIAELEMIAEEIDELYSPSSLAVHHRVGKLDPGEISVAIVVAAPHREAAFAACRYAIEELKKRVPIWKKEVFADGAEWVDPRP
jgi:molybdopterin synthase catalytic subunit